MAEPARATVSYAEYLVLERASETKHEYLDGEIVAMAGGTPDHARLAAAMIGSLGTALAGRRCALFTSDARIWVPRSRRALYPNVSVVCGRLERDDEDGDAITNPTVIVEVLSPSTEAYDRGEKFRHYRQIASLREYVLVSYASPVVEVWRRDEGHATPTRIDAWKPSEVVAGEKIRLASLDVVVDLDDLYRNPLAD